MINLDLSWFKYKISFRDSYLMLPTSLAKLAKQFKVHNKGIFPYDFANFNKLDYISNVSDFKYFNKITIEQYNNYLNIFKNKEWNFKNETINYCNQDCISLYQVIIKFNELIFNKYSINIHNYPTLPSLAFAIYRCHYLKDFKIPLISGNIFNDLKISYTGGATDMYIPISENIYCFDVNSLYLFVMKNNYMPVGNITYFE